MSPRILKLGHRGADVLAWQQFLTIHQFNPGMPDSVFGKRTVQATVDFQEKHGLLPDGIVGNSTLTAAKNLGFEPVAITDLAAIVDLPPNSEINVSLSPLRPTTLKQHFGEPGSLTNDCSAITSKRLKDETVTLNVGPFLVSGWSKAVEDLRVVFDRIRESEKEAYDQIQSAGMSCVRRVKLNGSKSFSNHSWGTAIDLFFGSDVDDRGNRTTQLGLLRIAPIFNQHGWFWGAEFSVEDSMHFELSEEKFRELIKA